jgi:type II secretory pathway pseudopilin PulG
MEFRLSTCNLPRRNSRGFTYLGVIFAVALIGIGLAATGTVWSLSAQREKEAQLLFVGDQFRNAIRSYYFSSPSGLRQYPRTFDDLLADTRGGAVQRHLRKIFPDPMSNDRNWEPIMLAEGVLIGVRSRATGKPIKRSNFSVENQGLVDAECYCEWRFVFLPDLQQ